MGDLTNFGHKIQSLSILWPAFVKPLTMSNDCPSHVHIFVHKYNLCPKIVRIWDKDYPTKKFGQSLYVCIQSLSRMCPHTWEVWLNWHLRCTFCPDLVHVQSMSRLNPCPEIVNFFQTLSKVWTCTKSVQTVSYYLDVHLFDWTPSSMSTKIRSLSAPLRSQRSSCTGLKLNTLWKPSDWLT